MAGIKQFTIQINGVQESINAVESLNTQLNALEARINALASKQVNISAKSSNSTGALNEEEKLVKQIQQTEEKIKATRTESYQQLLAEKDLLKEAVNDQKERAAQERLVAGSYSNTMKGLKEELADIKSVMQTTDLGDEKFKDLVGRAGQLTDKLKELEAQYGQFGRNVGNYASAAEGFSKFTVKVGDTVREFSSAREAARQLRQELLSLGDNAEGIDDLKKAINTVDSAIKDATVSSKAMDEALDMAQSFLSMAQAGQGLAAFFGLEDTGIEETIKNLVALQSALNGIEKLAKQMNSNEGIFKYFGKANTAIDNFTKKLFGVKTTANDASKATKAQAAATSQVATASKSAASAEVVQTTATAGLTVGMRIATVAARALGIALKAIGIGFILEAVSWLVEGIKSAVSWIKSFFTVSEEEYDNCAKAIDGVKKNTEELMDAIDKSYGNGTISKVQALTEQFHLQAKEIANVVEQLDELKKREQGSVASKLEDYGNLDYDTIYNWRHHYRQENGDITNSRVKGDAEGVYLNYLARVKKATEEADKAWQDFQNGVEGSADKLKYAQQNVENLIGELQQDDILRTVRFNLETFFPQEAFRKGAEGIVETLYWMRGKFQDFSTTVETVREEIRLELMSSYDREREEAKKTLNQRLDVVRGHLQDEADAHAAYDKKIAEIDERERKSQLTNTKKHGSNMVSAEETIQSLRLRLMKDNVIKRLNELDKERRETLSKVKGTEQQKLEIERLYNQLRLDALNDYINSVKEQYDSLKKSVIKTQKDIEITLSENELALLSNTQEQLGMNKAIQATIISLREYKELVQQIGGLEEKRLDYAATFNNKLRAFDLGDIEGMEEFLNAWERELNSATTDMLDDYYNNLEGTVEEKRKAYYAKLMSMFESQYAQELRLVREFDIQYEQNLADSVQKRLQYERDYRNNNLEELLAYRQEQYNHERYLAQLRKNLADQEALDEKEAFEKQYNDQVSALTRTIAELQALGNNATAQQKEDLQRATAELERIQADYQTTSVQAQKNYEEQLKRNKEAFKNTLTQLETNYGKDISSIASKYYTEQLQNYRDFTTKFNAEISKQPIKNDWGIINLPKTKANYKELQSAITASLNSVMEDKRRLNQEFRDGLITPEVYNQTLRELNDTETDFKDKAKEIQETLGKLGVDFYSTINEWIQQVGQAANSIMSSLSEITNNYYEEQISQQEKYIEEYSNLLDKQKDKTQEYADAVKEIEGELADARGDRRQQLIDALNAEMAAQRASLAEEKRIEKEKEKAERRKSELEYNQAIAEKNMSVAQAALNAVMAVSMAAVNKWPIPAIPMMALAAAVGAAQVAAAKSQYIPKPSYGDGGVIVGRSHAEGGVPVLGGQASVEGGEFITNKVTTAKNVDLLEYINSKRKKVDISDLLEFYNSGRPAKNITSIRTKFADGGVIPSLRSDIELSDRMYQAMEDYANRPTYVQVVDIIDRTERLNEVKVISGLEV